MERKLRIVLTTDYSEAAMNAERYAVQLATIMNARLFVVHASQSTYNAITDTLSDTEKVKKDVATNTQEALKNHCENMLHSLAIDKNQLDYECIAKEGKADRIVCQEAERLDADVIVTGAHGYSANPDARFGSHTWQIIKQSRRPVLVVPKNGFFTSFERIVFATGNRKGELPVLRYAIEFLRKFNPNILALHIIDENSSKVHRMGNIDYFRKLSKKDINYGKLNIFAEPAHKVEEGLNNFCEKQQANLLIMSNRHLLFADRLFNHNHTRKMTSLSSVPLLVMPEYYVRHEARIPESFDLNETFFEE